MYSFLPYLYHIIQHKNIEIMKQKCNHSLAEIEENEFVNQQYHNKINLICEFLTVCDLRIENLCVHLNIDTSTYYCYKNGTTSISIGNYICACTYFQQYMKDNGLRYAPELISMIKQTEIFSINRITTDLEFMSEKRLIFHIFYYLCSTA